MTEAKGAESVMGKGIAELVTGERGSRVSDGEKGVAELVTGKRGSRVSGTERGSTVLTRERGLQNWSCGKG